MKRLAILGVFVVACSAAKPPCTPTARDALLELYKAAANDVINSGACDGAQQIEQCPAYIALETHFTLAEKAMCERK